METPYILLTIVAVAIFSISITYILCNKSKKVELKSQKDDLEISNQSRMNELDRVNSEKIAALELSNKDVVSTLKETIIKLESDVVSKSKEVESLNDSVRGLNSALIQKDSILEGMSDNVLKIREIFSNNQARGAIGEIQLDQILKSVFGDKNDGLYQMQYQIDDSRVDAAIFHSGGDIVIPVDSKFPLSGYHEINHESIDRFSKTKEQKEFSKNVLGRVKEISSKYLVRGKTTPYAIMFIPSEAVYSYICAYHTEDVLDEAFRQKVILTGPNTLVAAMLLLQAIQINEDKTENAEKVEQMIEGLSPDVGRLVVRTNVLVKHTDSLMSALNDVKITSNKISTKFKKLELGDTSEEVKEEVNSDE